MTTPKISDLAAVRPGTHPPKYDRLIALAKQMPPVSTIVVHPCDETSLRGAVEAAQAGIIIPILVGPAAKISAVANEHRLDISQFQIVDVPHSDAAAAKGVQLIQESKGELLMKGSLTPTSSWVRSLRARNFRTARRISHVFIMDVPNIPKHFSLRMQPSTSSPTWMQSGISFKTPSTFSRKLDLVCRELRSCPRSRR